jgi:uncharacterized membrane protein
MDRRLVATRTFGWVMVVAGVAHFVSPAFFLGFFRGAPAWVPALILVYASGVVEAAVGVMAIRSATAARGTVAIFGLMIAYLPIHLIDVLRDQPAVGSATAAWIRLPLQLVLIAWAWWISPLSSRHR